MSAIERDLAALSGEPITILISGREVKVKPYTPRILGKLTAWLKSHGTHPVASVRPLLKDCSPAERDAILKAAVREASENWPPQIGSAQANELFGSGKGLIAFLEITLSPANPEMKKEDYEAIGDDISMRDYSRLLVALTGRDPVMNEAEKDIEDDQDPNGETSAA